MAETKTPPAVEERVLSVDEMLAAQDIQYATISAWGGAVRIGSLTAGDVIDFIDQNEGAAKRESGIRLIVKSLVDKDGNRIGTEKHIEAFKTKDAKVTQLVIAAVLKLNGLDPKVKEADAPKND